MRLSTIINTWNEEKNIKRAISSVLSFSDEIIIVDMDSQDKTVEISKSFGARVFPYPYMGYVEPARNFAIKKAKEDWILILDADEEISRSLAASIKNIISDQSSASFYRFPRKNITFGKWIRHGMWWPDYQIRLFRRGFVQWNEEIHSVPFTKGEGRDLPAKEGYAITHHNYQSISQFIDRMNRYTTYQVEDKKAAFEWKKLLERPLDEFLRRFFMAEGYKDGLHGLVLALLQGYSEFVVILKDWESRKFPELTTQTLKNEFPVIQKKNSQDLTYWLEKRSFSSTVKSKLKSLFS